jgi:peptidoglycan/LPS O-acetylase OafA/YrhL
MQDKASSTGTGRSWSFEYLRVLAAFGIVCNHVSSPSLHWGGAFGLWIFLLISFTLLARSVPGQAPAAFAGAKARRVLLPWLFWSAFYLLWGLWHFLRHGVPFFEPWMLFTGFSLHLWYLPYLFLASIALHLARRSSAAFDQSAGVLLITVTGLVMLAADGMWHTYTPPFDQWSTAVPLTLFGYALGRIALVRDGRQRRTATMMLAASVTAVCLARVLFPGHYGGDAVSVLAGLGTFMIVGALPLPPSAPIELLSTLTLGIYLIHPFVRDVLTRSIGESSSLVRIVMIFTVSAVIVYGMRKIPVLRAVA